MPQKKTPAEIMNESGNKLHCEVATFFRQNDWTVLLSPYYVDNATDKAREIDIVCEKRWRFTSEYGPPTSFHVQLFIECKFVLDDIVFWFDVRDHARANEWLNNRTPFKRDNSFQSEHHYIQAGARAAKLFQSGSDKSAENDPIFKALNQCLGGLIQHRQAPLLIARKSDTEKQVRVQYPVILCSGPGKFYQTDVATGGPPSPLDTNFVLEVNYAYLNDSRATVREYFLIDVVTFSRLAVFLAALDHEVEYAQRILGD